MESSGGLLPLLEGAIPIARPSSLKSKKETVAQSDIDHANIQRLVAFNESMPWPTVYEDCPDYKEHFRRAINMFANSVYEHERAAAHQVQRQLRRWYTSSPSLRALSLRLKQEREDFDARGHNFPLYLKAWIWVKRFADESFARREILPPEIRKYTPIDPIPYAIETSQSNGTGLAANPGPNPGPNPANMNVPQQHRPSPQFGTGLDSNSVGSNTAPNQRGSAPRLAPIQSPPTETTGRAEGSGNAHNGQSNERLLSTLPSSHQTSPSSLSDANRISQAGQGHAKIAMPLNTANTNKGLARRPQGRPRPHPKIPKHETGGFGTVRGNGDNNYLSGAPMNEQTTPNRHTGTPKKPSKKREGTPDSDEANTPSPSKRSKPSGRIPRRAMENEVYNQQRLEANHTLSADESAGGIPDPKERAKWFRDSLDHRLSEGVVSSCEQSGLMNQNGAPHRPQQHMPAPRQPMQNSAPAGEYTQMPPSQIGFDPLSSQVVPMPFEQTPPLNNVAPSSQSHQTHTGYGPLQSPHPQMGMMPDQVSPLSGAKSYQASLDQSPPFDDFGFPFVEPGNGMPDLQSPMVAQGQAQQPPFPPPNEVRQMFGDGYNYSQQPNFPPQNANTFNAMQNQGGYQGQNGYGSGHGHPSGGNGPFDNNSNVGDFNPFLNGN